MFKHDALHLEYLVFHKPFRADETLKIDDSNEAVWERKSNAERFPQCKENGISWN